MFYEKSFPLFQARVLVLNSSILQLRNNLKKILRVVLFLRLLVSVFYIGTNLQHDFQFVLKYMENKYSSEEVDRETAIWLALSMLIDVLILPCTMLAFMTVTPKKQVNKQRIHLILPLTLLLGLSAGTFIWYYLAEKIKNNADRIREYYQCDSNTSEVWIVDKLPCFIGTYLKFFLSLITVVLCGNYFFQLQNTTITPEDVNNDQVPALHLDNIQLAYDNVCNALQQTPYPQQLPPLYKHTNDNLPSQPPPHYNTLNRQK